MNRTEHIAETIRAFWPHRMSLDAAKSIRENYFRLMMEEIRDVNKANGWYDDARSFGEGIALLHSEVSEALEAFREWGIADATKLDQDNPKPEGVGSEFADILIRLLDEADRQGIDLEAEYERKIAHNRTRGYKHGGKTL